MPKKKASSKKPATPKPKSKAKAADPRKVMMLRVSAPNRAAPVAPAASTARAAAFDGNVGPFPPANDMLPPKTSANTITYTLSLRITGASMTPYFSWKSYDPHPEMDVNLPLRMRISPPPIGQSLQDWPGWYVDIILDQTFEWYFQTQDTLMLGTAPDYPPPDDGSGDYQDPLYYGLTVNASQTTATFYAYYYGYTPTAANPERPYTDPYNLNFLVYIQGSGGNPLPNPLSVSIDPDIKNPGDPP
jgi:hypothetical protein